MNRRLFLQALSLSIGHGRGITILSAAHVSPYKHFYYPAPHAERMTHHIEHDMHAAFATVQQHSPKPYLFSIEKIPSLAEVHAQAMAVVVGSDFLQPYKDTVYRKILSAAIERIATTRADAILLADQHEPLWHIPLSIGLPRQCRISRFPNGFRTARSCL